MKEDQDFSEAAKDLLDILVSKIDPISWCEISVFGDRYFICCFQGRGDIVCAAKLENPEKDDCNLLVEIFNKKNKNNSVYLFCYSFFNLEWSKLKNKKENASIYGHVEVEGFSYRDENYFAVKSKDINKYNNYVKNIIKNSQIGCFVDSEQDYNPCVSRSATKQKSREIKVPSLKIIKKMIESLNK